MSAPKVLGVALCLLLTGCPQQDEGKRGDSGYYCKHDGTCNSPALECRNLTLFLGIPVDEPTCFVKERAP